ncbi:MAG: redoxin domain-containing protein [Candidatus Heimdallarchaeota archaeon]|nr:redoxin domain-containing protein [Candidatus Heimdallarchaeota archaeon]
MNVGDTIPDFTLKDQNNEEFRLYDIEDKMVLLSFHPLAWTGVCTKQMQSLEDYKDELEGLDVIPIGVSVDSTPSKRAWTESIGVKEVQLLSDFWPHGDLSKSLDLFLEDKGVSKRANILVGKNKEIVFMKIYEMSTIPNLDEITDFIRKEKPKKREV